jgi:hypothetical protein
MLSTTRRTRFVGALMCATALCGATALAGLPAAMDLAPVEALAVVAVGKLADFNTHVSQLIGAVEAPAMMTPEQALGAVGLAGSVDMNGSAAVIVQRYDEEADHPELIVLLPVRDYKQMLAGFGEVTNANGVDAFQIEGTPVFSKQVGAYAALGNVENAVRAFQGKPGATAAFEARLGASGKELAASSDVVTFVNPQAAEPHIRKAMEGMSDQMGAMAGMGGAGGAAGAEQAQQQAKEAIDAFVRDATSAAVGMTFGAKGAGLSASMNFKAGSECAASCKPGGDATALLNRLPAQPFLFAFAVDMTAPLMRDWMKGMAAQGDAALAKQPMGLPGFNAAQFMELTDGQAAAVYPSPGGLMGGLFVNTLMFTASRNPQQLAAETKKAYEAIQGQAGEGMGISATYTPGETQVSGVSVDGYSMIIDVGGGGFGNPMAMLFGPAGGPNGYIAAVKNGLFQTFSRDTALLTKALAGGAGVGSDESVAQVAAQLPKGRCAEFYLGVKPVLDQALVFAAMFLGPMQIDLPESLPPVGAGVASRQDGAIGSCFVPAPVIKVAVEIAGQVQAQMGGEGDHDHDKGDDGEAPPF